jgi:peptide-methionine (S)-S-oxide reductase
MSEEIATLGGGCFWCLEAVFKELRGVTSVTSGYAGGHLPNPSYKQVCTGTTGHAEVVQVRFDPAQLTYADLLRVFFTTHDPTTRDRQGNDIGPQYRSIILTHTAAQAVTAKMVMKEIADEQIWPAPIVTKIEPLMTFFPAEDEHHDYFARNPWSGYCQVVIAPKVMKFRKLYRDRLKQVAAA